MVKRVTRRSSAAPSAETDQPLQLDTYSYGLRTRSTEVDLMMECEEEELSDVQLAAIQRAQADHDKANQLIMEARQGRKMVPASQPNTFNILPHTEARSVNPSNMEKMETSSNADVILISESPPPAKTSPQVMTKLMTSLGNVTPQQVYKFVQGPMNQPPSISNGQWIIRPLVSVTPQKHGGHQAIMTTMGLQQPQVLSIPFQSSTTPLTAAKQDFNQVHSGQRIAGTYGLGIRTSEPINSLPINSPPATVAKKKKGTANESEKDSSNWVPLDEYYYGKKEGDPQYSESKEEYRFKCWYCSKMLYNNVRTMQHIQGHIDSSKQQNIDLSDLTQCKQCYKQFDTPFEMQSHLEKVHLSNQVLMCRICEKDQATHRDLRQHMRVHHVACEMPYVCQLCNFKSSMYSDVVDHFKKKHDSSQHLLCLYCLRSFNVKFVSQGWGQTQTYYGHLLKHQSKSSTRKCGICRLTFFNPQDVKQHRKNNHLPNKGVIGSSSSSFTLDSVMIKVNDSGLPTKTNKLKSLNAPSVSKVEDIGGVRLPNAVNDLFCFECRMSMGSNDHYKKHINCSMCRFATSCSVAYANHMMGFHSGQMSSMNLNIPWERQLPQPMYCPCGFSSRYGNRIANHLAFCTSGVCFSSMQESPDTSKSFGAISIDEAEKTSESSIILDVLGLMKKSALTSYSTKNTARRSSTGKFLKKSLPIKSTIETKTTEANDAKKSETSPLARSMFPARARLSLMDSDRKLLKTKTLLAGTVGKADAEKVDELEKHNDLQMSSTSRAHRTKYVSILQSDKNAKNIKVEVSPEKDKYQVKTVVLGSDQSAELNKESEITVAKQSKDEKGEETEEPMTEEISKVDQPMTDGDTKIDLPKEDKDLELNQIKSEKDSICDQPMEKDDLKSDQAMEKDDLKSDQAMEKDYLKSDQALKKDDFKSEQAVEKDDFKSDQAMEKDDFKSDQAVEKDDFKSDQAMGKDDLKSDQAMGKDDLESEHLTEVKETKPTESKKQEIDVKPVTEMEVVEEHSSDAAELQSSDSLLNTDTQSSSENQTQAKPVEIDDQSATTTQPQQIAQSETRYQQKDDSEGGTEIAVETETDEIEDVTVEKPTEGPSDSVDVNKKMEESIDPQSSSVGPQFSSKDAQSSSMESEQMTEDILSGEEGSEAEEEDRNAAHGMEEGGDSQPKGGNSKGPVTSSPITSASETEKETAMQSEEKLSSSFTKGESQPSVDDQQSQDSSTQSRQHGRERLMDKTDHSSVDGTHGRSFHRQQEPDRDREHHYRHDNRQSLGDRQHQRDRDQLGDRQHQRERDQHGGYSKHRYDDRDRSFDRDRDYRDRGDYGRDRDRSNEHDRGRRYHQDNRGHPGRYQGQGYGSQGNDGDQRQGGPSRDQDRNRGYQQRGGGNQNYRGGYRGGYY